MLDTSEEFEAIDVRLGGHRFWYLGAGRWVPQVRGGDGDDPDPDDDLDPDADPDADPDDGPKFTQADLDKALTREKRQGRRAAIRELMEKFGFKDVDEAEAFIKQARDGVKPPKKKADDGDADDRERELTDRERELQDRESQAERRELHTELRAELLLAGAPKDRDKLSQLVRMVDVEDLLADGYDETDIEDAVADLKTNWPALFESDDNDDPEPSTPDTTPAPSGGRRRRPAPGDGISRGEKRFEERHPTTKTA